MRSFANGNGIGQSAGMGPGQGDGLLAPWPEHWWTLVNGIPPK